MLRLSHSFVISSKEKDDEPFELAFEEKNRFYMNGKSMSIRKLDVWLAAVVRY